MPSTRSVRVVVAVTSGATVVAVTSTVVVVSTTGAVVVLVSITVAIGAFGPESLGLPEVRASTSTPAAPIPTTVPMVAERRMAHRVVTCVSSITRTVHATPGPVDRPNELGAPVLSLPFLDGYEVVTIDGAGGGSFVDGPYRIVLHTTEGSSIDAAIRSYQGRYTCPHLTVDPVSGRKAQHLPLDVAAYALMNQPGGVETNREDAIQVEIVGFAAESPDWADEVLTFLAGVILDILTQVPVPLVAPEFVGPEAGTIASASAPQRMTFDQWDNFAGICGHQHVPENDHWDPGHLNIARVFDICNGEELDPMSAATIEAKVDALTAAVATVQAQVTAVSKTDGAGRTPVLFVKELKSATRDANGNVTATEWYSDPKDPRTVAVYVSTDGGTTMRWIPTYQGAKDLFRLYTYWLAASFVVYGTVEQPLGFLPDSMPVLVGPAPHLP